MSTALIEWPVLMTQDHLWKDVGHINPYAVYTNKSWGCYFCDRRRYPKMWPGHTLCSCCGALIYIGTHDPGNESMFCCRPCDQEMLRRNRQ